MFYSKLQLDHDLSTYTHYILSVVWVKAVVTFNNDTHMHALRIILMENENVQQRDCKTTLHESIYL